MERRSTLTLSKAPLVESALGVIFRPLSMRAIDLAPLRDGWRSDYPLVEEQPPLPPVTPSGPVSVVLLQIGVGSLGMPRYWFLNTAGTELIQIQQDRLFVNWRKGDPPTAYPRYKRLRDVFGRRYREFGDFIATADLGQVQASLVEVTYVNALEVDEANLGRLDRVVRLWSDSVYGELGEPEEARLNVAFRVPGLGQEPSHLFVDITPAQLTPGQAPVLLMTLTLRAVLADQSQSTLLEAMDYAHDQVLRCFLGLTTEAMHEEWGLVHGSA